MQEILAQIVLAARDRDSEGWMNILFVMMVALFYVVAGFIKRASEKKAKLQQGEEAEDTEAPPREQAARRTRPIRSAKVPAQAGPARRIRPAQAAIGPAQWRPQLKIPIREPAMAATAEQAQPAAPTASQKVINEYARFAGKRAAEPKPTAEPFLAYDDPAKLRHAIIHYEIFGRPVALREPGQNAPGLSF